MQPPQESGYDGHPVRLSWVQGRLMLVAARLEEALVALRYWYLRKLASVFLAFSRAIHS